MPFGSWCPASRRRPGSNGPAFFTPGGDEEAVALFCGLDADGLGALLRTVTDADAEPQRPGGRAPKGLRGRSVTSLTYAVPVNVPR